jgi:hypothetical protein
MLYVMQTLDISQKVVITVFPDSLFDINFSTNTIKTKIGNTSIFVSRSGEVGFSRKIGLDNEENKYSLATHSFLISPIGFTYKNKYDSVIVQTGEGQLMYKLINNISYRTMTIKFEGLAIGITVTAAIILVGLITNGLGIEPVYQLLNGIR